MHFEPLVAFEMARLCTRLVKGNDKSKSAKWSANQRQYKVIGAYTNSRIGHLPQGAPTSPMLANLAVRKLDAEIESIAAAHGLTFTRYADDIALSTNSSTFSRQKARSVIGEVYRAMGSAGFSPNATKTKVVSPGARKVVLGLLVDGNEPRLTREFKARLRQHLHYLVSSQIGPTAHAAKRKFASTQGLCNHVRGLISYATQVEKGFGDACLAKFGNIVWPI
jgi:RNA-directed DNA polymerase